MKKICLVLTFVFAIILLSSCTTKNNVVNTPTPTKTNINAPDYSIVKSKYTNKKITIYYPQLVGYPDSKKQTEINTKIVSEALNGYVGIGSTQANTTEYEGTIDYSLKLQSKNLLSIVYSGYSSFYKAAHPTNELYSTTIDLRNNKLVNLKDFIVINDKFFNEFKNKANLIIQQGASRDMYIEELKKLNTDVFNQNIPFYLTDTSLGISFPTIHVMGDHMEFEIQFKDLTGFKTNNTIWNDLG